ncbi:PEGA domain-containing protein [bacterium]|nr:PEGA domain-containing protein [bacterium]
MEHRRYYYLVGTFIFIAVTSLIITLLASGFRLGSDGTISQTGIISINSAPEGALVYINDVPQDATNTNITQLKPGTYSVRLEKEGFVPWKQDVDVVSQTVTRVDSLLVPLYPSFNPLTYTGVANPSIAPDGQRIVYKSTNPETAGIWLLELEDRPFNLSTKPRQLLADTENRPYSTGSVDWSPSSNEIKITMLIPSTKLSELDNSTTIIEYFSIQSNELLTSSIQEIDDEWKILASTEREALLNNLSDTHVAEILALNIHSWSPDNSQILHTIEKDDQIEYHVYNVPDSNTNNEPTPTPQSHKTIHNPILTLPRDYVVRWFPDSSHLLITHQTDETNGAIEIVEIMGTNRVQVYSGSLSQSIAYPNPNGSRIIILARFNQESDAYNLYGINLR